MKALDTFAAVMENSVIAKVFDAVPSKVTHAIGALSGATGLTLWAEHAKNLSVIVGFFASVIAGLGALFYASYWGIKALREWREFRNQK